jgi:hypothetical protein
VVDLETTDVDLAIRYSAGVSDAAAKALFGEELVLVASPALLKSGPAVRSPADAARYTLIETGDVHRMPQLVAELATLVCRQRLRPAAAAALAVLQLRPPDRAGRAGGQGLAIARLPLVADALAAGT